MIVIVGGGWAGLSAAVSLTSHGHPVTLLEATRQLGGRARCVRFGGLRVDIGQHLLLGTCTAALKLFDMLAIPPETVVRRRPLYWIMRSTDRPSMRFRCSALPAPLHLGTGLLTARGLSLRDRMSAGLGFLKMVKPMVDEDISVADLLQRYRQSQTLIELLWNPICLAALNTPVDTASASIFTRLLQQTFTGSRHHADLLFPITDLGTAIPAPAADHIEAHGGRVLLGQKVSGLIWQGDAITGVRTDDTEYAADHVVLAVPHAAARRLLADHPLMQPVSTLLAGMENHPVCTVYLHYPQDVQLGVEMTGLHGTMTHWLFDHRFSGNPGLLAAVISGRGAHMDIDNTELAAMVTNELAALYPKWPRPAESLVVREKNAAFPATVGINSRRPGSHCAVTGLWLAGDYTDTGLPATLEGAVRSGFRCADGIINACDARDLGYIAG